MAGLSDRAESGRLFRFKQFSVSHARSALKLGTDAVVLGAAMTVPEEACSMLDIGTGCGIIALMVAQRCNGAEITGIDIDLPSVEEASGNFASSPWKERLRAVHCRLQDYEPQEPLDQIFSNPPYYDASLLNPDGRESSARHTLDLSYRDICAFAARHLKEGGRLCLILPSETELQLRRCAASFSLVADRIIRISTGKGKPPRRIVVEFVRGGSSAFKEESLCLYSSGSVRSEEYSALCSEFYL